MIEREIEVFRVGGKASRGIKPEHLAEVAAFDCAANPVPICFGHPSNDTPAAGTIAGLRADGNSLFAKVKTFSERAIEGIKNGEWINRSFAFFDPTHEANPTPGKWAPRHLGLLGGAAPGIPGMGPLQAALAFAADGETLEITGDPADGVVLLDDNRSGTRLVFVSFDSKETRTMEKTPEQIAEDKRLADLATAQQKREDEFAARVRTQFEASNGSAVDALVAAGKVLPAEAPALKLVFNALGADELEFGAADKSDKAAPAGKLAAFLTTALSKRTPVDDKRISPSGEFSATSNKAGDDYKSAADDLTAKARALMKENPALEFGAAIERVSGGGHAEA